MDYSPPGSSVQRIFQSRYLNELLFPTPGNLPNPGIEPVTPVSPASAGEFCTAEPAGKTLKKHYWFVYC